MWRHQIFDRNSEGEEEGDEAEQRRITGIMVEERIMEETIRKEETEDRKKGVRMKGKRKREKRSKVSETEEEKIEMRKTIIMKDKEGDLGKEKWNCRRRTGFGENWVERRSGSMRTGREEEPDKKTRQGKSQQDNKSKTKISRK